MRNPRKSQFNPSDEKPCHNHSGDGQGSDDPSGGPEFARGQGRGRGHGGQGRGRGHGGRGSGGGRGDHAGHGGDFGPRDGGSEDSGRGRGGPGRGRGLGPRGSRRASRGDVRLAVLSLLSEAPSNGYGLITAIADRTSDAWRPSSGSVYPTLAQLVDEGLITANGDGRGTEYGLTETGRTFVQENKSAIERAWAGAPGRNESEVDFHESVTKLKGVIHQFRLAATDEQRATATERLDEARRALYLILAD